MACPAHIVALAVNMKHLTVVFLLSLQYFHAVCDLAAAQVSLLGSGTFPPQRTETFSPPCTYVCLIATGNMFN